MNTETNFCLRVDVDTFEGLKKGIPKILDIAKKFEIPATVYLSLGKYVTGRNLFRRIKEKEKLSFKLPPWKRNSFRSMLRGVILPAKSIKQKERKFLREISAEDFIDIHPHGYNHVKWSSKFTQFNFGETINYVSKMKYEYRTIFGEDPIANAAPNFKTNSHYFQILDKERIKFSSDFQFQIPFFLKININDKKTYNVKFPQLPVTEISFDELIQKGMNSEKIVDFYKLRFKEITDKNIAYTCFYIHAGFEPIKLRNLFEMILNFTSKYDMKPNTHLKYSQQIKDLPKFSLDEIKAKVSV